MLKYCITNWAPLISQGCERTIFAHEYVLTYNLSLRQPLGKRMEKELENVVNHPTQTQIQQQKHIKVEKLSETQCGLRTVIESVL